jgi:hypothetical protein
MNKKLYEERPCIIEWQLYKTEVKVVILIVDKFLIGIWNL